MHMYMCMYLAHVRRTQLGSKWQKEWDGSTFTLKEPNNTEIEANCGDNTIRCSLYA